MKLKQLLAQCGDETEVTAIANQLEKVTEGCAYVCHQKNEAEETRKNAKAAAEAGARVIISEIDCGLKNQILVENTRVEYAKMCSAYFGHPSKELKVIGVTGTNGKTTTCFIINSILKQFGCKTGLLGTVKQVVGEREYESTLTTSDPFELHRLLREMADEGCEYCTMEVSSHALSQSRVEGIRFECAVFTNLSPEHLDYHKTMENYKETKKQLFRLADRAVLNLDDEAYEYVAQGLNCPVATYSAKSNSSDYTAKNIRNEQSGVTYELVSMDKIGRVHFGVPGEISVYNSMAAAVCAIQLGFDFEKVTEYLKNVRGVSGRLEVLETGTDYTVIIDYAHTPDGLEKVLRSLREFAKRKIILVFGCGGDRDSAKRPVMGKIAGTYADEIFVTSDNPRNEDPMQIIEEIVGGIKATKASYAVEADRRLAISRALKSAKANDIVLLAGKGHEAYQLKNGEKLEFDEHEIVTELLKG